MLSRAATASDAAITAPQTRAAAVSLALPAPPLRRSDSEGSTGVIRPYVADTSAPATNAPTIRSACSRVLTAEKTMRNRNALGR